LRNIEESKKHDKHNILVKKLKKKREKILDKALKASANNEDQIDKLIKQQ
jgi:hypothetical protein